MEGNPETTAMKTTMIAAATAALMLAGPAAAETGWTATGPKGGTASGTFDCTRTSGGAACEGNSLWTGPRGREWTGSGTRTFEDGTVTGQRVGTGPRGRERTIDWRRTR